MGSGRGVFQRCLRGWEALVHPYFPSCVYETHSPLDDKFVDTRAFLRMFCMVLLDVPPCEVLCCFEEGPKLTHLCRYVQVLLRWPMPGHVGQGCCTGGLDDSRACG